MLQVMALQLQPAGDEALAFGLAAGIMELLDHKACEQVVVAAAHVLAAEQGAERAFAYFQFDGDIHDVVVVFQLLQGSPEKCAKVVVQALGLLISTPVSRLNRSLQNL